MEQTGTGGSRFRRLLILSVVVILGLLVVLIILGVMLRRATAQGIATGYVEAAITAYQMDRYGRPLPNRMFETGPFRVDTKSQGTPPVMEVAVKDRYLYFTYYSMTQAVEVAGRPMPVPTGSP